VLLVELDGGDRALVHDLERRGHEPARDDRAHRAAGRHDVTEDPEQRVGALGQRRETHRQLGQDAERALAADHGAHQVVAGRHADRRAEPDDLPVRQHQLERQHVVRGGAVLERVRAARVLGGVAAERAGQLARRVGRVEQPVPGDRLRQLRVHDAGLHHRDTVRGIDAQDAVQAGALDHDAVLERDGAARQPGAGPARHERHAVRAAGAHYARDLRLVARQHDRARQRAVHGEAVGLVHQQLFRAGEHRRGTDDLRERSEQALHGA